MPASVARGRAREGVDSHVRHPSIIGESARATRGAWPGEATDPSPKATILDGEALEDRTLLSTFTVNSLGDAGAGTGTSGDLRYVITQADQTAGDNTIDFSVTGTITLNSALPDLSNTTGLTDIEGPGAANLTVARSGAPGTPDFGIFTVDADVRSKLVGLTITGGSDLTRRRRHRQRWHADGHQLHHHHNCRQRRRRHRQRGHADGHQLHHRRQRRHGDGGGIENERGTLTVTNSTIDNNSAHRDGGGIFNSGTLTVTNSTIPTTPVAATAAASPTMAR